MRLHTTETMLPQTGHKQAELTPRQFAAQGTPLPTHMERGLSTMARVDHGRWIADCPYGCGGAQLVHPDDKRFLCVNCWHQGGGWARVKWPKHADEIEAILAVRPFADVRNWQPWETVAMLRQENREHGLPESS